jgi:two component transcriptional regulator, winged helix family
MPNILLVEDDSALSELIASYLQRNDFHVRVIARGDHVLDAFRQDHPDLVILDLMLPGIDGLQLCRLLRQASQSLPILMLTARDDSHDQVLGLEMGADDYVTKPCEPRVLLARVRTLLRRSSVNEPRLDNHQILIGGLRIDLAERLVSWRGEEVELSSGEYNLLVVLARNAGGGAQPRPHPPAIARHRVQRHRPLGGCGHFQAAPQVRRQCRRGAQDQDRMGQGVPVQPRRVGVLRHHA